MSVSTERAMGSKGEERSVKGYAETKVVQAGSKRIDSVTKDSMTKKKTEGKLYGKLLLM